MTVIAKLFGAAREAVGAKELSLALLEGATARDVWGLLLDEYPAIAPFADRLAVSVNLEICSLDSPENGCRRPKVVVESLFNLDAAELGKNERATILGMSVQGTMGRID